MTLGPARGFGCAWNSTGEGPYSRPAGQRNFVSCHVRSGRQRGSVTAELAVALPSLTVLLALLLLAALIGVTQLRLEESARSAARALARGDPAATAVAAVRQIAGHDAVVTVSRAGGYVRAEVSIRVSGPLSGLVSWPLTADAVAREESVPVAVAVALVSQKGWRNCGSDPSPGLGP